MHWFLKFIFGIKLYMFRTVPLSIIRNFSTYTQQWYMSYRFADSLQLDALISEIHFWNKTTCFGQFLCPSSGIFHCTHSNRICHTGLLCVQWKPPDDGQRNCPKHVEFYSKNKFEKLVHLVGFIIRIYHDTRSPYRQTAVFLNTTQHSVVLRVKMNR